MARLREMVQKGRGRQARGDVARARLLDAGRTVVSELTLDQLLTEVGPRRATRRLGDVSTGAFYHHFPNREAFLAALLDHALGPRSDEVAPETVALIDEVVRGETADVLAAIEHVARADFGRQMTVGLPDLRFQLCAWIAHGEPRVRDALRGFYDRFTEQYTAAYEVLLARWGREFRPPFTARSAAAVLTALVEGIMLRACIDPELAGPELYGQAVRALLPMMTRTIGDPEQLGDVVAELRHFSLPAPEVDDDPELRRRVLDVVQARSDAGTFDEASIDDIAREAGVARDAVYRRYLSKPGLAAATFARFVPLLERALEADLSGDASPVEAIRHHLARLADIAGRHRALTNALLDTVQRATARYGDHIGPTDPRSVVPLPQLLEPTIRAGQERAEVRDDFDAFDLATLATNLLLLRIMTMPGEAPAASAQIVSEVVLHGMATNPARRTL